LRCALLVVRCSLSAVAVDRSFQCARVSCLPGWGKKASHSHVGGELDRSGGPGRHINRRPDRASRKAGSSSRIPEGDGWRRNKPRTPTRSVVLRVQ
jgi:hypothetical protein